MNKNEYEIDGILGFVDRCARIALGVGLFGFAFADIAHGSTVGWIHVTAISVGIYPSLTGMLGWDPYYQVTHVNTCATPASK